MVLMYLVLHADISETEKGLGNCADLSRDGRWTGSSVEPMEHSLKMLISNMKLNQSLQDTMFNSVLE